MTAVETARSLFDRLDGFGAAAEPGGSFDRAAIEAIVDAGIYGASVPKEVGGLDLPLTEVVDVWAEIARADGSIGWVSFAMDVAVAYFGAYLTDEGVADIFDGPLPWLAGQYAPNGTATADGDEWVVNGNYQFGSGIALANMAGGGFLATPAGGGDPDYLFGCYPVDRAELKGNWDVLGLQGTQSMDYAPVSYTHLTLPTICSV